MIGRLIRHYIISDEIPLEGRLFNIITSIGTLGSFLAAVMTAIFADASIGALLIGVLSCSLFALLLFANRTGSYQAASMLICLCACCVMYPLIFFTSGGTMSGMPCWFILGIVIIFAMLCGRRLVIVLTLAILTQLACVCVEYFHPDWLFRYEPYGFPQFEDVVQAYLIVGLVVGLTIKLQLNVYEKEKKKADAAAEAKAEFLANMSHEIRTPLNAILGMNELIVRESESETIRDYALNVEGAGRTLLALINDVLDLSRIEAGRMDLVNVEYRLSTLIQDVLNLVKERIHEKKLILKLQINPNIPDILYGDEVRIRQIVTNLLTNAVKYTDRGSITLIMDDTKLPDESRIELYLAVEDTGRGIREEDMPQLFETFRRVNERENRYVEGTGLGLPITKQLVELMNGTIGVTSTWEKGSRFYVSFTQTVIENVPLGNLQENAPRHTEDRRQTQACFMAPEARILIVDDNAVNRTVVKKLLERTRMRIDTAQSGEACLQLLRQQEQRQEAAYDLILLDHMMPQMDGIETLAQIRTMQYAKEVPVIALTANAISGSRQMYLEAGFTDYITKPVSGQDLEKMLMQYISMEKLQYEQQATKDVSERLLLLKSFIDYDAALHYSTGTQEGVLENIQVVLEEEHQMLEALHQSYVMTDWAGYAIQAHALKGILATIGLHDLSDRAKHLELAAKEPTEENLIRIIDMHTPFTIEFQEAMQRLHEIMEARNDQG